MSLVGNTIKSSFSITIVIITLSVLIYILKGFLSVFVHEIGPLSAVLGAVASLTTCAIAIYTLTLARRWHKEKIKGDIFLGASEVLNFINCIPLQSAVIYKRFFLLTDNLNKKHADKTVEDCESIILDECGKFNDEFFSFQSESMKNYTNVLRYHRVVDDKYKDFVQHQSRCYTKFLSRCSRPIVFDREENKFKIEEKFLTLYNSITKSEQFAILRNELPTILVNKFINFDDIDIDNF